MKALRKMKPILIVGSLLTFTSLLAQNKMNPTDSLNQKSYDRTGANTATPTDTTKATRNINNQRENLNSVGRYSNSPDTGKFEKGGPSKSLMSRGGVVPSDYNNQNDSPNGLSGTTQQNMQNNHEDRQVWIRVVLYLVGFFAFITGLIWAVRRPKVLQHNH